MTSAAPILKDGARNRQDYIFTSLSISIHSTCTHVKQQEDNVGCRSSNVCNLNCILATFYSCRIKKLLKFPGVSPLTTCLKNLKGQTLV